VPANVGTIDWFARDFAIDYGSDTGYGRLKAMTYPSGEAVVFDYSAMPRSWARRRCRGTGPEGPTAYRVVDDMSVRGQHKDAKTWYRRTRVGPSGRLQAQRNYFNYGRSTWVVCV
jgi:hypothetical protein